MKQPWIENPFRLISWLEMNKFSAEEMVQWTSILKEMEGSLDLIRAESHELIDDVLPIIKGWAGQASELLKSVGCDLSSKSAARLADQISPEWSSEIVRALTEELHAVIKDELSSHLFFWVPFDRASWYGKTGRQILGDECVNKFTQADIANEAEQAAKCFAFGQYTACAFHMMRISEAGVKALALSINYPWSQSPNWGKFYKQYDAQLATNPTKHVEPWLTHSQFLEDVGGNLRAVKDAWRNDTMHLDKVYDEDQAKHLLAVIPSFMKHLASKLDENGQFV